MKVVHCACIKKLTKAKRVEAVEFTCFLTANVLKKLNIDESRRTCVGNNLVCFLSFFLIELSKLYTACPLNS